MIVSVRFADAFLAEDAVHRFFKFIQVCIFLYIGAASGNFDPGNIQTASSSGLIGADAAKAGKRLSEISQ